MAVTLLLPEGHQELILTNQLPLLLQIHLSQRSSTVSAQRHSERHMRKHETRSTTFKVCVVADIFESNVNVVTQPQQN